jgi:hypothetical protein
MLETTVATQRTVKVGKRNGLRLELSVGRWTGAVFVGLGSFAISYRYRTPMEFCGHHRPQASGVIGETPRRLVLQVVPCDEQKATDQSQVCSKNEFAAMKRSGGAIPQKRLAMNVAISG